MEDTKKLAYKAMFEFLDDYYSIGKSDDIGTLLGNLSLLDDGISADLAMMQSWDKAYAKAQNSTDDDYLLKLIKE